VWSEEEREGEKKERLCVWMCACVGIREGVCVWEREREGESEQVRYVECYRFKRRILKEGCING